ncbi:MAG: hypothetical protein ACREUO_12180 [Burkholderiales bacterium]
MPGAAQRNQAWISEVSTCARRAGMLRNDECPESSVMLRAAREISSLLGAVPARA